MQFQIFRIPTSGDDVELDRLNRFLNGNRIVNVESRFVEDASNSHWSMLVSFDQRRQEPSERKRIDYREVLSERDFAVYVKVRDLRKQLAEEHSVPVFAVFTNEQLAEISERRIRTIEDLEKVKGVSKAKAEKYGPALIDVIVTLPDEPVGDS